MRKGTETFERGARRGRREQAVWLLARETAPTTTTRTISTTGVLALDETPLETRVEAQQHHCALIVDRDPALAEALARALQARFDPARRVRFVRDSRALSATSHAPAAEITVIDASATNADVVESFHRLRSAPGMENAEAIFITPSAMTYQLSQFGVNGGIVLRQPQRLDDIVNLVSESLAER